MSSLHHDLLAGCHDYDNATYALMGEVVTPFCFKMSCVVKGPTGSRTQEVVAFKVQSANHYTIEPLVKIYFGVGFLFYADSTRRERSYHESNLSYWIQSSRAILSNSL